MNNEEFKKLLNNDALKNIKLKTPVIPNHSVLDMVNMKGLDRQIEEMDEERKREKQEKIKKEQRAERMNWLAIGLSVTGVIASIIALFKS